VERGDRWPARNIRSARPAAAVVRHGIRGLVIDPYNEIEHRRPVNMSETEYVSQILGRVRRFADNHGLHIWFVAHPRIMRRDKADGPFPVPTLYDISGSANWANKADIGVVVHRPEPTGDTTTEIHVRKARYKSEAKLGTARLRWDRSNGRYEEISGGPTGYQRTRRG
jgi:twinkle protein